METIKKAFLAFFELHGAKLLWSILVFGVGALAINLLIKFLKRILKRSKLNPLAHKFVCSLLSVLLYVLLSIIVISMLGVDMTSIVAMLSVVGIAVGLAVQDLLSNFAGGFILLVSKPFAVGDYVELDLVSGIVKSMTVLQTKLLTIDNKTILVPNGQVTSAKIINYSAQNTRRIDLTFSIAYNNDFHEAKKILGKIVDNHSLALKEPVPVVRVSELAQSSVNIICKIWVNTENYWDLYYDLVEQGKDGLDRAGFSIPFPQLDVHVKNQAADSTIHE